MEVKLKPTGKFQAVMGVRCRLWEGQTDKGTPVTFFVPLVEVPQNYPQNELEAALQLGFQLSSNLISETEIARLQELLRGVGANRYWEGRWRDEKAENDRLRTALETIARHSEIDGIQRYALWILKPHTPQTQKEPRPPGEPEERG